MAEVTKEITFPHDPCDLVLVREDGAVYVVEVERDIAKLGDRVDFQVDGFGMLSGFVEDLLHCDHLDRKSVV